MCTLESLHHTGSIYYRMMDTPKVSRGKYSASALFEGLDRMEVMYSETRLCSFKVELEFEPFHVTHLDESAREEFSDGGNQTRRALNYRSLVSCYMLCLSCLTLISSPMMK